MTIQSIDLPRKRKHPPALLNATAIATIFRSLLPPQNTRLLFVVAWRRTENPPAGRLIARSVDLLVAIYAKAKVFLLTTATPKLLLNVPVAPWKVSKWNRLPMIGCLTLRPTLLRSQQRWPTPWFLPSPLSSLRLPLLVSKFMQQTRGTFGAKYRTVCVNRQVVLPPFKVEQQA